MRTYHKNTEVLVVASKDIEIEANSNNTKCMVMSRDRNEGRRHNTKIDNSSFQGVDECK
jgi:hypothetical protein